MAHMEHNFSDLRRNWGNGLLSATEAGNNEHAIPAEDGFTDTVQTPISQGADIDSSTMERSALIVAATDGHYETVEALLEGGANVNFVGHLQETALTCAAIKGNAGLVKLLLRYGADMHYSGFYGNALACASRSGHTETAEILLQAGSDVESTGHLLGHHRVRGQTSLMLAAQGNYIKTMKLLLGWGAEVNKEDAAARMPLHHAAQLSQSYFWESDNQSRNPAVKMLLEYGANIRNTDRNSQSGAMTLYGDRRRKGFLELALERYRKIFVSHSPEFKITETLSEDGEQIVSFLYAAGAEAYTKNRKIMPQFIVDDQENLQALTCLCRKQIRAHFLRPEGGNKNNLITAVKHLPLPRILKQYLLFDILT